MCGRYVAPGEADLERAFQLGGRAPNPFPARYNVLPTDPVPVLRAGPGGLELVAMRWGLIPPWWKDAKPPRNTINARFEDVAGKPVWRDAYRFGRCLIPATGWYEWAAVERVDPGTGEVRTVRQPYYIYPRDRGIVGFAGLMATWQPPAGGAPLASCAILTRAARGPIAEFHERMPVVLAPEARPAWLDPALTRPDQVAALIERATLDDFAFHPVGMAVGSRLNEGPQLIEPAP